MIRTFALVFVLYIVTLNAVVGDETPTSSSSQVDAIVESVVNSMNDPYLANNLVHAPVSNSRMVAPPMNRANIPLGHPAVAVPENLGLATAANTATSNNSPGLSNRANPGINAARPAQVPPVQEAAATQNSPPVQAPAPAAVQVPPPAQASVPAQAAPPVQAIAPVQAPEPVQAPAPAQAAPPPSPPAPPVPEIPTIPSIPPIPTPPAPGTSGPATSVGATEAPIPTVTAAPTHSSANSFSMVTTRTTPSFGITSMSMTSTTTQSRTVSPTSTSTFISSAQPRFMHGVLSKAVLLSLAFSLVIFYN